MLAEISIIPIGKNVSISPYVARAAKIIDESGFDYRINPMSTIVEAEMDDIFDLIKKCHQAVMEDAERVTINIVLDDRKDKEPPRLDKKLTSVEEKVGKTLKK